MRPSKDVLLPLVERLAKGLVADVAGRERAWAQEADACLAALEQALVRHATEADAPGGVFAEVDCTRPSLVRQVGELKQEHTDFLEQVRELRKDLQAAARAFGLPAGGAEPATATVVDFDAIRRRGQQLAATLRHHRDHEAGLVIESVTTDLGAGD
jgi:hypothetical protein